MLKKSVTVVCLLAILFAGKTVLAGEALDQLKDSIDRVVALLEDDSLKAQGKKLERRDKIFKVLEKRFDFSEMGKRSLAKHWKKISEKQREAFVATFSRLMENSYISKIERYTDEKVVFKNERPKGDKYYYVYTEIISGERAIPINYSLHKVRGQWFVYDVNIEGVSLVTNYRTQFKKTIRKEKFVGLMSRLTKKLKDLEKELKEENDV